ncbi:hypothetical protein A3H38_03865 [candidate division WOR-1 bacterium RIFCSPLOWO2_02_FULL_46_20]|uniref:N-acetyltransferase domain-containing protein n=1 Tax=candidate division WOR-1 bacterium RIFCSPLOWO2_02_FULL_46_20 TaxID=1802567 RepID=A0A1F4RFT2_UNCSA|nr:MAG: hypothetical protein A3H38_03865 [candidate division WOR-1 bacterium RIFCSPLOWO2_02_FULL_46_20]
MITVLIIRPQRDEDKAAIKTILDELDLFYAGLKIEDFWVAEQDKTIVGCLQLTDYKDFLFLGSLGISLRLQKSGLGKALMDKVLKNAQKTVYLYTVIPDFFAKLGFKVINNPPHNLPRKASYGCENCHPKRCATMRKEANAARISQL